MNVYILLIVIFSVAFVAPIARWLHVNYFASLLHAMLKWAIKLKRRVAERKSKFQQELEKIMETYGESGDARI